MALTIALWWRHRDAAAAAAAAAAADAADAADADGRLILSH